MQNVKPTVSIIVSSFTKMCRVSIVVYYHLVKEFLVVSPINIPHCNVVFCLQVILHGNYI